MSSTNAGMPEKLVAVRIRSSNGQKDVRHEAMVTSGDAPGAIVARQGLTQVSDEGPILAAVEQVLAANASKVEDYRSGKDKLFGFFVGQVMKATGGKANPGVVNDVLLKRLKG